MSIPSTAPLQVLPSIYIGAGLEFLAQHLGLINVLRPAKPLSLNTPDQVFNSNEDFWRSVLDEKTRALNWVKLNNFQTVDWYPRSPGIYHSWQAAHFRSDAEQFVREEDGVRFYKPHGKLLMLKGGIGTVRFKSVQTDGEDCWLCTATSDGYCHSGVPLLIPNRIIEHLGFDSRNHFNIHGQVRFLPPFLEQHFSHLQDIPQVHIFVEKLERISTAETPVHITPVVFFRSSPFEENRDLDCSISYATCAADDRISIDAAVKWIEKYTRRYKGEIITNFDQQRLTFENAPFSLQKVMVGQARERSLKTAGLYYGNDKYLQAAIEKGARIAVTVQAERIENLHLSGDFRNSFVNIDSTLNNANQTINSDESLDSENKRD